eukprot:gene8352-9035_t
MIYTDSVSGNSLIRTLLGTGSSATDTALHKSSILLNQLQILFVKAFLFLFQHHSRLQPSAQPSRQPISRPTGQPTSQPSEQPTSRPTNRPTSRPMLQSTNIPTTFPSNQPSSHPTLTPSSSPSALPSSDPSVSPSVRPNSCPTTLPSASPTLSPTAAPKAYPTSEPSMQPSSYPSSTPQPTQSPTTHPTNIPTRAPSYLPTARPTIDLISTKSPTTSPSQLRDVVISSSTLSSNLGTSSIILGDATLPSSITLPSGLMFFDDDYEISKLAHSFPYGVISDQIGRCLASAGDVNKDVIIDILLGDFHSSKIYVFFGNRSPLSRWKDMNQENPSLSPTIRQSKLRTIAPTSSPLPTIIPTYRRTSLPSPVPTVRATKTIAPSYTMTRSPSIAPTLPLPPSVIVSSLSSNITTITEGGVYSTSSQSKCCSSCAFLISTSDDVTIIPQGNDGCKQRVLLPSLSSFGSLTASNFIFTSSSSNEEERTSFQLFTRSLITAFAVSAVFIVLTIQYAFRDRITLKTRDRIYRNRQSNYNNTNRSLSHEVPYVHKENTLNKEINVINDNIHHSHDLVDLDVEPTHVIEVKGRRSHRSSRHEGCIHNNVGDDVDSDSSAYNNSNSSDDFDSLSDDDFEYINKFIL